MDRRKRERRGGVPLIVGGTGFYIRALFEPLFDAPPSRCVAQRALETCDESSSTRRAPAVVHAVSIRRRRTLAECSSSRAIEKRCSPGSD